MQTIVTLLGLLSTHKQWSIDKNPAIPTLPSRLVVTALIMEIGYLSHFPVLTVVEIMLTSQKWKRTFWRDYIFFMEDASSSSAHRRGRGKGWGKTCELERCYATTQSNGNRNAVGGLCLHCTSTYLWHPLGRNGAAWSVVPPSNYTKSCETVVSNNYLYGDEWRIGRKYSWVAFRIAFAFVITRGVTSLQGRKGISL